MAVVRARELAALVRRAPAAAAPVARAQPVGAAAVPVALVAVVASYAPTLRSCRSPVWSPVRLSVNANPAIACARIPKTDTRSRTASARVAGARWPATFATRMGCAIPLVRVAVASTARATRTALATERRGSVGARTEAYARTHIHDHTRAVTQCAQRRDPNQQGFRDAWATSSGPCPRAAAEGAAGRGRGQEAVAGVAVAEEALAVVVAAWVVAWAL